MERLRYLWCWLWTGHRPRRHGGAVYAQCMCCGFSWVDVIGRYDLRGPWRPWWVNRKAGTDASRSP